MITLLRSRTIFNEAITTPMRWLTANSHALADYNWSARSMGRTLDRIYKKALLLKENPTLIINEEFIMGIMNPFKDELPPFAAFNKHHYGKKTQHRVVRNANKNLPNKELRDGRFHHNNPMNIETYF